jgi:hypothetical protein
MQETQGRTVTISTASQAGVYSGHPEAKTEILAFFNVWRKPWLTKPRAGSFLSMQEWVEAHWSGIWGF